MKTIYRVEVEYPTDLIMQRKTFLFETQADCSAFTKNCAVAGVRILGQGMDHLLTAVEVAADIQRERRIAAELAGNALTGALTQGQRQLT